MSNSAQRYSGHGDRGVIRFNHDDIVRSEMVKQLVIAFEREGGYVS